MFFTTFVVAQDLSTNHFTSDNGLPSNEVYKIIEDRNGFIWIATDRGVAKYDGYDWQVFTTKDGLSDNVIFWIFEDDKGRIWFTGQNKTICYYFENKFTTHPASPVLRQSNINLIYCIYVDEDDIVWLGVYGETPLLKIYPNGHIENAVKDKENFKTINVFLRKMSNNHIIFGMQKKNPTELNGRCKAIVYSKKGELENQFTIPMARFRKFSAVLNENTIYLTHDVYLSKITDTVSSITNDSSKYFTISLFIDQNGMLWAGQYSGGVVKYSKNLEFESNYEFFDSPTISSVYQDREGGFWFSSTEKGLFYCPSIHTVVINSINEKVRKIVHSDTTSFAGTYEGQIYKISLFEKHYNIREINREYSYLNELYVDLEGHLWASRSNECNLYESSGNKIEIHFTFANLVQQKDSSLWFTGNGYINKTNVDRDYITDSILIPKNWKKTLKIIAIDNDQVAVATWDGLWITNCDSIYRYRSNQKILERRVNDLQLLENGTLVVSSMGEGLILVNTENKILKLSKEDGLLSDLINCSVTVPGDSVTWVGSNSGLTKITWSSDNMTPLKILNFTISNGLQGNEILDLDYRWQEEKLWAATSAGIMVIDVKNFLPSEKAPLIHQGSVYINYLPQDEFLQYKLSKNDLIQFTFTGISPSSRGKITYKYRLNGLHSDYQYTINRLLEYKSLPPGQYELEVYAVNSYGIESLSSIKHLFVVFPSFWQTWWFLISAIFLVVGISWFLFKVRYIIKQREYFLLMNSLEAEQEALSSQITPHFLFNAMNSIQNLITQNKSKNAVIQMANFASLMRKILYNVKQHAVLLSDEIETVSLYMDLEALRLNGRLSYNIICGPSIDPDHLKVPPLIIQPFIENSIWHGINNKDNESGVVDIFITNTELDLIISIKDDGIGRQASQKLRNANWGKKKSTGINSVKRRIEVLNKIYGISMSVQIYDLKNHFGNVLGTEVIIKIPLNYEQSS